MAQPPRLRHVRGATRTTTIGDGMGGFSPGGFSRRGIQYAGVTLLLFPVWYPLVEEDGLRWPRAGDLPLYAFMMVVGAAFLFWSARSGD